MPTPSLSLLVLKTRQVDRLHTFYTSLGIELTEEQHGQGPVHYAGRIGESILEIYPLPETVTAADSTTRLGFLVEDLTNVLEFLLASGAVVVTKPRQTEWELRAVIRDPDGRAVELYQRS